MSVHRPNGVVAVGVIYILISILGFLSGMQPNATEPGYTTTMITYISSFSYVCTHLPPIAVGLDPLEYYNFFMTLWAFFVNSNSSLNYLILLPLLVLICETLSGAYLITAVGLLYMKKWGQRLGLIMGAIPIAGGTIFLQSILIPIGILIILFGIAIIGYLIKVRNEFE